MQRRRYAAVYGAVAAVAIAGLAVVATQVGPAPVSATTTTTTLPPLPLGCTKWQPDPAKAIAKVKDGKEWNGKDLCYLTAGAAPTHAIGMVNATLEDVTPPPPGKSKHSEGMAPIILVKKDNHVTLANLTLIGSNPTGEFHAAAVGQAGISVRSSSYLTITNVTTTQTFGDGLTLFLAAGKKGGPDLHVTVNGFTDTLAGRDGISPAFVQDSTFTNLNVEGHDNALDFESDILTVADSNLTFDHVVADGGINIIQKVGTVNFLDTAEDGHYYQASSNGVVTYSGSFLCNRRAAQACVSVKNGTLIVEPGTVISYRPGNSVASEPEYLATPPGVIVGA